MKKTISLLLLFLGIVFLVPGQTPEPIDLILVLDTSSSMSGSSQAVTDYVTGPFLREFLRIGDTFHLISFSGTSRSEISRRIEGVGDVETLIGRLFLMFPVDPYSDIAGALDYTERYITQLPSVRPKKVVFITDGDQSPQPGSANAAVDSAALENRINETAARLRRNGADFNLVKFHLVGSGPSSGRPSRTAQAAPRPAAPAAPPQQPSAQPNASARPQAATPQQSPAQSGTPAQPQATTTPQQSPAQSGTPPQPQATTTPQTSPAQPSAPAQQRDVTPPPAGQPGVPAQRPVNAGGFDYLPLIIGLGIAVILILGLIIFFMTRRLNASPNRAMAYMSGRSVSSSPGKQTAGVDGNTELLKNYADGQRKGRAPASIAPAAKTEAVNDEPLFKGPVMLSLVVDDQSLSIGRRNTHTLKAGNNYTIGGSKSDDFLIFLVPMPAHLGDLHFNGRQCTFTPRKARYFPEIGSQPVPNCIGKTIRVISDKRYELTFHFERYEDPLDSLNRLLNSINLPPKLPERVKKS